MNEPVDFVMSQILVVDDDDDVRGVLVETLRGLGYTVTEAASGEEALPLLDAASGIALVITDVRMPGMSGFDLVAQARAVRAGLKVIVISGYFQPQPVAMRLLRKPFHMHDLASAVRAELG